MWKNNRKRQKNLQQSQKKSQIKKESVHKMDLPTVTAFTAQLHPFVLGISKYLLC